MLLKNSWQSELNNQVPTNDMIYIESAKPSENDLPGPLTASLKFAIFCA